MMALVKLYGGKLYAFDVYGKDIRIFATYFEKVDTTHYRVRFGDDVDVTRLGVEQVSLSIPEKPAGTWLIADFAGVVPPRKRPQTDHKTHFHQQNAHHHARRAPTRPPETPWEILGVAKSARRDEAKRAFRKLARRLHPI